MMIHAHYEFLRHRMQPGDIIAFQGRGLLSWLIRYKSRASLLRPWAIAPVSHVGIVDRLIGDFRGGFRVQLAESTSLAGTGFIGVQRTFLSERLADYPGCVWWLPIRSEIRKHMDMSGFWNFLEKAHGIGYDWLGAPGSAFLYRQKEDLSRLFCSEHATAALRASGAIAAINASEVNPYTLCRFDLFEPTYYQLVGDRTEIRGHNTLNPEGFGQ